MNRTAQILFTSAVLLGSVVCKTSWAQEDPQTSRTVTEHRYQQVEGLQYGINDFVAGPLNPARVTQTKRQDNGRKIEAQTVEAPSANGSYQAIQETEQETIQVDTNTVRVVQRWFSPGNHQPFQMIEEERRTEPGGGVSVVRTTSMLDLSGRWQVQERDLEETTSTAPDTTQTRMTVLAIVGGGLAPVVKSEKTEHRSGDSVEVQQRLLTPDGRGGFQVFEERQSVTTKTKDGRSTDEKTYRDNGRGQMMVIEQTVSSEWQHGEKPSGKVSQMYSIYVPGRGADERLHLVQQRSLSTTAGPGGDTHNEEQILQVNPGAPEDGLRTTSIVIEVAKPVGKVRTDTHKEIRALDASGNLPIIWVTDSQKTREIR